MFVTKPMGQVYYLAMLGTACRTCVSLPHRGDDRFLTFGKAPPMAPRSQVHMPVKLPRGRTCRTALEGTMALTTSRNHRLK